VRRDAFLWQGTSPMQELGSRARIGYFT
jgi:hypothetical protein